MTASFGHSRWDDDDVVLGEAGPGEGAPGLTVGAALRAQRERLGWTLPGVSAHLRIRQPFLEAIEEGRINDLPGRAYAIGFIRTYAQSLGLDPNEIAQRFRAETGESARATALEFPAPVPDRGVPALAVVFVGAVLAIGAYAAWYRMSGNDRPRTDAVQPIPERLATLVPDHPSAPAETGMQTGTQRGTQTGGQHRGPAANPAAAPPAPNASSPALAPASTVPAPAVSSETPAPSYQAKASTNLQTADLEAASRPAAPAGAATVAPAPLAAAPVAGIPGETSRIELHATGDAWVRVREKGGHEYIDRVLKAGESWPVPDKPNLFLSTGNAAHTQVVINGVAMPSLGGDGVVRHDWPLDPEALRAKLAAAQPVAKPPLSPQNQ